MFSKEPRRSTVRAKTAQSRGRLLPQIRFCIILFGELAVKNNTAKQKRYFSCDKTQRSHQGGLLENRKIKTFSLTVNFHRTKDMIQVLFRGVAVKPSFAVIGNGGQCKQRNGNLRRKRAYSKERMGTLYFPCRVRSRYRANTRRKERRRGSKATAQSSKGKQKTLLRFRAVKYPASQWCTFYIHRLPPSFIKLCVKPEF